MTIVGFLHPVRVRLHHHFPCLADPARRSSLGLKVALVVLHLVFVGALFLFDRALIEKTRKEPWYTAVYLVLFAATLIQYFVTSGSSPGFVVDAMRAGNESHAFFVDATKASKQSASSKIQSSLSLPDGSHQLGINVRIGLWAKLVMDMYPPGSSSRYWSCTYCNILQPPRSKHCYDCDKCVLQFDHHCVWLGTCIGQGNHCRFWWYVFEETVLCVWTVVLYITFLRTSASKTWWKDAIMITFVVILFLVLIFLLLLLFFHSYLILTNQTTYELVRRRRIFYLRGIPERVYPFSKGLWRNIYYFCCSRSSVYMLEPTPTAEELEFKAKPYTCTDILRCRCC